MKRLTIAEYAELKGISVQAVYKKLKKLNTIKEERNGREIFLIVVEDETDTAADVEKGLGAIQHNTTELNPYSTDNKQENQPEEVENQPQTKQASTPDINPNLTTLQQESLKDALIANLSKQLEEKEKLIDWLQKAIDERDRQLKEQFDNLTQLLHQEQQLGAATHKLLLGQGEAAEEESGAPPQAAEEVSRAAADGEEKKKRKSWFSRLFE